MNSEKLSQRLQVVADFITKYGQAPIRLADIGSDHAYLPSSLILSGAIEYAVAGEVVQGPYSSAIAEVEKNDLCDQIKVRLADGFDAIELEDRINCVSICGMGGGLICSILDGGKEANKLPQMLVLQANTAMAKVREWLQNNNYKIIDEEFIEEKNQFYEILLAEQVGQKVTYTEKEFYFGPILLKDRSPIFIEYWRRELDHLIFILKQLKKGDSTEFLSQDRQTKLNQIFREINRIEEVLGIDAADL